MRERAERVSYDIQISGGSLHSGYPIMGHIPLGNVINVTGLQTSGTWGVFHELGHNHQWKQWSIPATGETGCNWWSMYMFEYIGIEDVHKSKYDRSARIYDWILSGKPWSKWEVCPAIKSQRHITLMPFFQVWIALDTYSLLADKFGWLESYTPVIRWYYDNEVSFSDDMAELDFWARLYIQQVGFDLCSYFEWWGWELTDETRSICSELPQTDEDLLKDFNLETDHGNCPDGWHPYGEKCYFFSEDQLNWWEAEEKCDQVGDGAHLASCFTEAEVNLLASVFPGETSYHIGLSDLAEHDHFVYLDGSSPTGSLPWATNEPDNGNGEHCVVYAQEKIQDVYCMELHNYVCQTGPGTCAPNFDTNPNAACPDGWQYWQEGCYWFEHEATKSWQDALDDCKAKHELSKLVEIQSESEQLFLAHHAEALRETDMMTNDATKFWIGLESGAAEAWADGQALSYQGWCEGEPDRTSRPVALINEEDFCWGDKKGGGLHGYICEMPVSTDAA